MPGQLALGVAGFNSVYTKLFRKAPRDTAINDLQFIDVGWYLSQLDDTVQDNAYSYDMRRSVEYPAAGGVLYPVTWSGVEQVTVVPGEEYTSDALALPSDITAGAAYRIFERRIYDYDTPAATLTVSGGQFSSAVITNAGRNLGLGQSAAMTGHVSAGAGTGGAIACVITSGELTQINLTAGSGYTDGDYPIFFRGGAYVACGDALRITGELLELGSDLSVSAGYASDPTSAYTNRTLAGLGLNAFLFGPCQIVGRQIAAAPAIGVLGDSFTFGTNDSVDSAGQKGFVKRAIHAHFGVFDVSRGTWGAWRYKTQNPLQNLMLANITQLLCAVIRNDIFFHLSNLATLKTDLRATWAPYIAADIPVFQVTCMPSSNSTDGWVTTANQTVDTGTTVALDANDWLRADWQTEGLAGIIDIAAVMDSGGSAAPTGKWTATGGTARTADGVHPNATGSQEIIDTNVLFAASHGIGRRTRLLWSA